MVESLIYLVVYLVVVGIILGLLLWIIDQVPMPDPYRRIAKVVITVIGCLILIFMLLSLIGAVPPLRRLG
jgi:hypothetical protein